MNITGIQVSANRAFPDPDDPKTTLRMGVCLKAELDESDIHTSCTKYLQERAERLVEDHRDRLVSSLENRRSIQHCKDRIGEQLDLQDETGQDVITLEESLHKLLQESSIFNEKPEPKRKA